MACRRGVEAVVNVFVKKKLDVFFSDFKENVLCR